MPNLPTLTVTDAQATRLLAAWGSVAAYKEWLRQNIISYVLTVEGETENAALRAAAQARMDALAEELNTL